MLSADVKKKIKDMLIETVWSKLEAYKPETTYMPFHYNLIGRDVYALFSFIQSLNTTFGMSIWEQLGVLLALDKGKEAKRQYILAGSIDTKTEIMLEEYMEKLRNGQISPDKEKEKEIIKNTIKKSNYEYKDADRVVDLFIKNKDGSEEYYDITSAKPNMKEFVSLKRKLLRWMALRYSTDNTVSVQTMLGIPYNPYHPKPYERWTLKGLYDLKYELLVGEELWNHIYEDNIYDELLGVFKEAGRELRPIIGKKFEEFKN